MHAYIYNVPVCEFSFRFEFLLGRDTVNTFLTLFMQLKINYVFFYTPYTIVYLPCVRVCVSPSSVKTDPGNSNETVSAAAAVVREFTRNS